MARNRKRTRDRRQARTSKPVNGAVATAAGDSAQDAPEPLAHAAPDSELAEAQLALGRPEFTDDADEAELSELAAASAPPALPGAGRGGASGAGDGAGRRGRGAAGELALPEGAGATTVHGQSLLSRLVAFLQGSYRELQRVQWPDRRQVFQATGVVIGFVIVAGVFLGVSDVVAQKIVNLILYGHG